MAHPHGGAKARDAALDSAAAARRQHSADEGVPRYDPHADHAAYHDSAANLHPHDAHDDRAWRSKAEVEEWRSAHFERRASVARSVASGRSSTRGGGGGGAQETLGGLSEADVAHMSDAEIAQHHFRLAQQHLEAAQRLSLAAVDSPSRYARSTQSSSVGSLRSPQARFAREHEHDSASSSAYGESASGGQDDQLRSPVSAASASPIERDLRRLSIDRHASSSYDERRRSALQVPAPGRALEPPSHVLPSSSSSSSPSSHFSTSPSSLSLRSAPSLPNRTADDGRAVPQRPVPPPRRATVGAATAPATFESASALAPSLYGGGVPLGVPDRLCMRSASAGSSPADSVGVSRSASSSSSSSPHWPRAALEPPHSRSRVEHDAVDPSEDDDDARSDFFDAQSTISHVTNSPLPSYSDPYERPAVPSIPEEYLRPVASAPLASMVGDSSGPPSPSPSHEPVDDFHGFRPRHAPPPQQYSSHPPSHPAHAPVVAHSSSSHPPFAAHGPPPSAPIYAHPVAALSGAQPHSYILGADGRPIPVYSAPAGPHFRAGPPAPRSALPIHSQPLQFDHSLPYAHRPPQASRGPVVTTAGVHPTLSANVSPLQPYSPHASPLAPSSLPTLSTQTSTASFAPFTLSVVPRPPSPSSSTTTTTTHRAPSISGRSRMASLRAAVKSPHVRFMSPSPEARSRASEPPPTSTSTSTSMASRSGRVGSSLSSGGSATAAARGRMGSFFGASASGGDALRREQARAAVAVPEVDDEESEAERRKRQGEAMQQSFGMLL
ncbi:hypothetical protein JCM8208_003335 [Rhodotorula glutinis]